MNATPRRVRIGAAPVAMDLTDGSERGEYVAQDYLLQTLGRPMRAINLMYCYYPLDKGFPKRARDAFADMKITYQWDYPYDDYFPYTGGLIGNRDGAVFEQMRDIRAHGQDVMLTLTCDPTLTDEHLIAIAKDLRPFGRVFFRLNHEATGDWFAFTKRADKEHIAAFYVRAGEILHEYAPNVQTILCLDGLKSESDTELIHEKPFTDAIRKTDIWSLDRYMALHFGWPFDVARAGGDSFYRLGVREVYGIGKRSFERMRTLNGGKAKPMTLGEFNADGDVTGPFEQCEMAESYFRMLKDDPDRWLSAVCFYMFRDRGRLGLETEDPNHPGVGIAQPILKTFRKWIHDPLFEPRLEERGEVAPPFELRWRNSEDADGVSLPLSLPKMPCYCELYFEDDGNYVMELNGRWFYKSPRTRFVDLMPAFFETPGTFPKQTNLRIFAPPPNGENDLSSPDEYRKTVKTLPRLRLEFEPVEPGHDR